MIYFHPQNILYENNKKKLWTISPCKKCNWENVDLELDENIHFKVRTALTCTYEDRMINPLIIKKMKLTDEEYMFSVPIKKNYCEYAFVVANYKFEEVYFVITALSHSMTVDNRKKRVVRVNRILEKRMQPQIDMNLKILQRINIFFDNSVSILLPDCNLMSNSLLKSNKRVWI